MALKNISLGGEIVFPSQLDGELFQSVSPINLLWQPCFSNLATLMALHISKYPHCISRHGKHGSSFKNRVSKLIRRIITSVSVTHYIFRQPSCGNLATLLVLPFSKYLLTTPIGFLVLKNMVLGRKMVSVG